jgi:hypothetical protein
VTSDDIATGVEYARKSLPWTFNRMSVTGPWTWYRRMMRIVVGVTVQNLLLRKLKEKGLDISKEWKKYRDEDTFDIKTVDGKVVDVKALNHFYDDDGEIRPNFSLDYLMENKGYTGDMWQKFFPCMAPDDQNKKKDAYVFAILDSEDYLSKVRESRNKHFIIASPSEKWMDFLNNKRLAQEREKADAGLDLTVKSDLVSLDQDEPELYIGYERKESFFEERMRLTAGSTFEIDNVSALSYIRLGDELPRSFVGEIAVSIKNSLKGPVFSGARQRDLNESPGNKWKVTSDMFADLYLPGNVSIHFLGWISSSEFKETRSKYPSYGHPDDKIDPSVNQPGRTTEGGVLFRKTNCYIYPNTGSINGGLKNTNYYVVPGDLNIMSTFAV